MFLFDFFRSFLPLHNPIGFGAADFIELAFTVLLVVLAMMFRPWIEPYGRRLAVNPRWSMALLAAMPVALRLALLPHHAIPSPTVSDEFSHLLVADTLLHFRLANPAHSLRQFFETFFVLQEPTYSSIYAVGQGMALALGRVLFGHPWAGVALSVAAICSLCYWMLRAWTTPGWALVGGLVAVCEFGPLNQWMNTYWGGAVSAAAGCLVFGSLPRLRESARPRYAALLGLGLAVQLLTRPFESVFLVLSVILFFLPALRQRDEIRKLSTVMPVAVLAVIPAVAITLVQNKQVTGSWTTLPYVLGQYQYAVPSALTFQAKPVPHRALTPEQELDYKMQRSFLASGKDTIESYFARIEYRVRFYRFFFYVPLYLVLPFFAMSLGEWRFGWVALTLSVFALGVNFFPAFQFHYIAAVTCLFVLVSVTGLERLSRLSIRGEPAGREAALAIVLLCTAHFLFWYGLHVLDTRPFSAELRQYETWDAINHDDPGGRIAINNQIAQIPGKQLVFVRYWPQHIFQQEWVYNEADIDRARVVWARDLGALENEKLRSYYPDRDVWLLEPDARPPRLSRYQPEPAPNARPGQDTGTPQLLLPVPPA